MKWIDRLFERRDEPLPAPVVKPPVLRARPRGVSDSAVALSRAVPAVREVRPFEPAVHPPGVEGSGTKLAMDDAFTSMTSWASASPYVGYGDRISFLGFAPLAEMAQRPEYRRISETIAVEMTRRWIKFTGHGDEDKTEKLQGIEAAFRRMKVQDVFRKAAEHDGLFGRGHVFPDFGEVGDDELRMPIGTGTDAATRNKVAKGSLKGFRTVEPIWCYPQGYNTTNPLSPDWYRPTTWMVMGHAVHASRLLTIVGREVPDILKPAYSFGGLSLTQMAQSYVDNWLRTRQSVSDLIASFSVSGVKTDMTATLAGGDGSDAYQRAAIFANYRDNRGVMLLDKGAAETPPEEFFNVSTPLGTLDALQAQAQEQMASVSSIPLVKLLGITPSGLNASSDGEVRVFYDHVHSQQEAMLRSPLETVLGMVQMSEFGEIDPDIGFIFEPLWSMSEAEVATVRKTEADTDAVYIQEGVILPDEVRARIANDPDTPYAGLDLSAVLNDPPAPDEDEAADVAREAA